MPGDYEGLIFINGRLIYIEVGWASCTGSRRDYIL